MALVKTGAGIVDIRGGFGGVYFHRDQAGLHQCSKPRNIKRRSTAQSRVRWAFSKSRAFSTDLRTLSYNMFRCMSGLEPAEPPIDYKPEGI